MAVPHSSCVIAHFLTMKVILPSISLYSTLTGVLWRIGKQLLTRSMHAACTSWRISLSALWPISSGSKGEPVLCLFYPRYAQS